MAAELVEVPGTVPEAGQPGICLLDSESAGLSTQLLVSADEAEWLFVVRSPADMSTEWTWSLPATLPVDRYLSLWEIDSVGAPVGGTALDLAQTTSLLVPAGEERLLVVRYAADRTVDIALHEGWNLVSLPVAPVSGVLSEVFAEEGEPVVASSGYVWADGGYATVDEVSPLVGAWVYALRDAQLLVRGAVVSTSEMALVAGWNIVGVANPTEAAGLMAAGSLPGGFMTWDPTVRRYWWAEMLVPGSGYWVRSASAQSVPLGSSARRGL
jgi:hypothetical protein